MIQRCLYDEDRAFDRKAGGMTKKPLIQTVNTAERDIVINGTYIRVKSVFGDIPLEKALGNIVKRKLSTQKKK